MNVSETGRPAIARYRLLDEPAEDYTPSEDQVSS